MTMLFFTAGAASDPKGLILTAAQAARQRAQRTRRARHAQEAVVRLFTQLRRPLAH